MRLAGLMATNQITKAAALLCLNIEGAGVRVQSRISSAFSKLANTTSKNSVYVHLYSSDSQNPDISVLAARPPVGRLLHYTSLCYASASAHLPCTDVTVLHRYHQSTCPHNLVNDVQLLLLEEQHSSSLQSVVEKYYKIDENVQFLTYNYKEKYTSEEITSSLLTTPDKTYEKSALGGTFDIIHNGHKVLLYAGVAMTTEQLTIGVTDQSMNKKKKLCELITPVGDRKSNVRAVCEEINPDISYNIVTISDPFGPTITEESLRCIILSEETKKGGDSINNKRHEKGYPEMDSVCIPLVEDTTHASHQEEKISSSSLREQKLGQLLREPEPRPNLPTKPYLVGLTGGIASGKTSIGKMLEKLGAGVVSSDLIAHETYKRGCDAYNEIVDTFGKQILNPKTGEIERRRLGEIVFSDKNMLQKLNGIVWPATEKLVMETVSQLHQQGKEICFIEAALLLEADWNLRLHEVWTCMIPQVEAISRIMNRNSLSEEEAHKRISSQADNQFRVDRSNVVLSTLWDYEVTQKQVEKAWELLQSRLSTGEK